VILVFLSYFREWAQGIWTLVIWRDGLAFLVHWSLFLAWLASRHRDKRCWGSSVMLVVVGLRTNRRLRSIPYREKILDC